MFLIYVIFAFILWQMIKDWPINQRMSVLGLVSLLYFSASFLLWEKLGQPLTYLSLLTIGNLHFWRALLVNVGIACSILLLSGWIHWLRSKGKLAFRLPEQQAPWWVLWACNVFIILGILAFESARWSMEFIGNIKIDQIMMTLQEPLVGTDPGQIRAYVTGPLLRSSVEGLVFCSILHLIMTFRWQGKTRPLKGTVSLTSWKIVVFTILFFLTSTLSALRYFGFNSLINYFFRTSTIYETYYRDPQDVVMEFPQKKKNLIYIYLESMEASYASREVGGSQSQNLIPNLTHYALEEGTSFSNSDQLGGFLTMPSAGQTASAMVAQTSGSPARMLTGIDVNDYGINKKAYLPGLYSLGEVLTTQGYQNMLFIGSDGNFASRAKYFSEHGNYEIRDFKWAQRQGLIPSSYWVWWGYEDDKLFEFAKSSLLELADREGPFNFTMLTTDTHFEDGYANENTPDLFGNQYANVIHFSDQKVKAFIDWIKEQDFYQDTVIVIAGDHLTMDKDFFDTLDPQYTRSVYNVFLNSDQQTDFQKNRQASAVDMYPTTLAALGVKIEGDRLGIGTNLYSGKPTLIEEIGYDRYVEEFTKRSKFYEQHIYLGK